MDAHNLTTSAKVLVPLAAALAAGLLCGCGEPLILTVPDTAAMPGQELAIVARLQRREIGPHAPPAAEATITFRLADQPLRAARTDADGYAAVALPPPGAPGRHEVRVHHQSAFGETVSAVCAAYVLEPGRPVVAVDLDSLPSGGEARPAAEALGRLAEKAQLIYVTRRHADRPARARRLLAGRGCPDSAVLPYDESAPWYERLGRRDQPTGPLTLLRQPLPDLQWGLAADDDSAEAFHRAGLKVLAVRDQSARWVSTAFFRSWADVILPPGP